jgi:hypothetical protein
MHPAVVAVAGEALGRHEKLIAVVVALERETANSTGQHTRGVGSEETHDAMRSALKRCGTDEGAWRTGTGVDESPIKH